MTITVSMNRLAQRLDGSLRRSAWDFMEKLTRDDTAPGLHIEPITGSRDRRVRTGRVDLNHRAVLFKMLASAGTHYLLHGIYPHDEAIRVAKRSRLAVNPVNGVFEIRDDDEVTPPPPPPLPPTQRSLLAQQGLSLDVLVNELGMSAQLAEAAMAADDDDALTRVVERVEDWQGLALIDLAAGYSVAEVKERYELLPVPPTDGDEEDSDEALTEALRRAASRATFAWIEDTAELRRAIEEGDFAAWRIFLHPEQRRYAERPYNGPFRLSGGAGTGKTVVVVHRAAALARRGGRVIVTTYTKNLAESLRADLRRLDPSLPFTDKVGGDGVFVVGIDALASAVLRSAGSHLPATSAQVLGVSVSQPNGRPPADAWATAIANAMPVLPEPLKSPSFFAAEYEEVILPQRITTLDAYWRARRPGRGVALDRGKRSAVWTVIEAFRADRGVGWLDYPEVASLAASWLAEADPVADHVLVDEGQDLSPAHWQMLRALVAPGPDDLFIAEDSHQRIYGRRVVLSRYGINIVGRSQRLTLNYRTTSQNLKYAVRILEGGSFVDLEDAGESHAAYRSARSGPPPQLIGSATLTEEFDRAAELLARWASEVDDPSTIGVLVRYGALRDQFVRALGERGVSVRAVDRDVPVGRLPLVMTMHRAKGLEFARVLLFGVSEGTVPSPLASEMYTEDAYLDGLLRERSLLYVAASRARDQLAVSWSGRPSSLAGTEKQG